VALNRKAGHEYFLEKRIEAGIKLTGSEVKSLREGRMSIAESYAMIKGGNLWLIGAHIPEYLPAGQANHDPKRDRKLLVHKRQLEELAGELSSKGRTLIPTKCYFSHGLAKVEIAVAQGKKKYDKREEIKKKDARREMRRFAR